MKKNNHKHEGIIGDSFQYLVDKHPGKTAIVYLGEKYTYAQINRWVLSFAKSLEDMGVQKEDRVMVYIPNSPQWIIAWLAIVMRGAAAVPVTPIYTTKDIEYIASDSQAVAIICSDVNYGYVVQALPGTSIRHVIYTGLVDLLPAWKRLFGYLTDKVPQGKMPQKKTSTPFRKLLKTIPDRSLGSFSRDLLAEVLYTGGTTKAPKGVPITHGFFEESATALLRMSEYVIPQGENVILQGSPLFHILGQAVGLGSLCFTGDTLVLLPRVNLDAMLDHIQRYHIKTLFGVPTMYRIILEHDRLDLYDLGSLKYCFSGGDRLPEEIHRRWKEKFGISMCSSYGATETAGGIAANIPGSNHPPTSMGKVLPNKRIKIVNPQTLEDVEIGKPGECLVHSEPMASYYWNKPDETKESFVELDGRLWYRTTDVVEMDEEGYLYFVDRTVDIIKHKGYRISASEIESVLQDHPAVIGTCVVGIPDEKVGERIKAFVILKEDIKGITGHELIRWCRERLVSYKVPQYIEFRDMLPKSKVGKLLRREIRGEEEKRMEKGKWDESLSE